MNSCNCNTKKPEIEQFSLKSTKDVCHVGCTHVTWTNILFCILVIILVWYIVNKNKSKSK
jgi:hypothetical protein